MKLTCLSALALAACPAVLIAGLAVAEEHRPGLMALGDLPVPGAALSAAPRADVPLSIMMLAPIREAAAQVGAPAGSVARPARASTAATASGGAALADLTPEGQSAKVSTAEMPAAIGLGPVTHGMAAPALPR